MSPLPLILVVDDDWMNRELLEAYLQEYEVLTANSGARALELAHERPPDLVILDLRMPGMDGYEVCTRLRIEDATRETPILVMSGLNGGDSHQRALEAGADDILSKPFETLVFLTRVRILLRLKKLQDMLKARERLAQDLLRQHLDEATIRQIMDELLKADA